MKEFIKQQLAEALDDTNKQLYAKIMKPHHDYKTKFVESIKRFNDISDEMIPTIIDLFGHEGSNTKEEAIEDLTEKIHTYKEFPDPVKLYRVVAVKNKKLIAKDNLGKHFTPYLWAIDDDFLMTIGADQWDGKLYIMEVLAPISEIDVWYTITTNLAFPNEHEITLKNKGKGAKLISVKKY